MRRLGGTDEFYLNILHQRCWLNGEFQRQRYETLVAQIQLRREKGFNVAQYERAIGVYQKQIERKEL